MSDFTDVQWQPIGQLPLFEELIGGLLDEVQAFHATLAEAQAKPHLLDDATLDRVEAQYQERQHFLDIYDEQFRRWRAAGVTPSQERTLRGLAREVAATRPVVQQVLELVAALRTGTIDRIRELSDEELGLMSLLGLTPEEMHKRR
ncbi:hypothetical protein [Deinococcus sp.]|uniref:hypothetical protein n=1 Tax=Deinococcus sp. TaxID=47478 RepID=UPI003B58FD89